MQSLDTIAKEPFQVIASYLRLVDVCRLARVNKVEVPELNINK
jgi:hypothetical protein